MIRRAIVVLAACSAPSTTPANHVEAPEHDVILDAHAHLAANHAGIYVIDQGYLVRLDPSLHEVARLAPAVLGEGRMAMALAVTATETRVFASVANIGVVEVDPGTLAERTIAKLELAPEWLGVHRGELVVGAAGGVERISFDGTQRSTIKLVRGSGPAWEFHAPTAWLVTGDRLWYGVDSGEWGGGLAMIDLATSKHCQLGLDDGVYGFATDGEHVYAHGGMVHMGFHEGYVSEISNACDKQERYKGELPIVALVPRGDDFFGVAWTDLDDVSRDLRTWKRRALIPARASEGRPDAVAGYPGVTGVLALPGATLITTRSDGVWMLRGSELTQLLKPPS
jgi:hypothetical protein